MSADYPFEMDFTSPLNLRDQADHRKTPLGDYLIVDSVEEWAQRAAAEARWPYMRGSI